MVLPLRPTRRGVAVFGLAIAAIALSVHGGQRALPALLVPMGVAMAVGVGHLLVLERPSVDRALPSPDSAGRTGTVTAHVDAPTGTVIRIDEAASAGLSVSPGPPVAVDGPTTIEYELSRDRRGVHELGPMRLYARDPLGLVERRFQYDDVATLTVYPPTRPLDLHEEPAIRTAASGTTPGGTRGPFDRLDEYRPGDSLRDIHWASTAKLTGDDLLVRRYADDPERRVIVAIDGPTEGADALASAAASVIRALRERGETVDLIAADGRVSEGTVDVDASGDPNALLARTDAGRLEEGVRRSADVVVRTDGPADRIDVEMGDRTVPFESLLVDPDASAGGDRTATGGPRDGRRTGPTPGVAG